MAGSADISDYQYCAVADGVFIMNIQPKFNYDSLRAQKARFSVKFGNDIGCVGAN